MESPDRRSELSNKLENTCRFLVSPDELRTLIADEMSNTKNKSADVQKYTYWHMFCTRELTVNTCTLSLAW